MPSMAILSSLPSCSQLCAFLLARNVWELVWRAYQIVHIRRVQQIRARLAQVCDTAEAHRDINLVFQD